MSQQAVRAIIINGDKLLVMHRNKFGTQYYTLVGGGVDVGEDYETALRRELREETGLEVGTVRHVFTEDAGDPYGVQYIYLCDYQDGEPVLSPDSDESKINALGRNFYEPQWLPLKDLPRATFLSASVKQAILDCLQNGFPNEPQALAWKDRSVASLEPTD